ncbi:SurA N-terminal domain-containing protein [Azospirillum sp. sgz301742]
MLQSIRNTAGSWVVKILFVLLIASFGVWGIGDVVRRSAAPSNVVADVGPVEITRAELDAEFRRQMDRLRPMFGGELTVEQARQFGLVDQSIATLVQRTLYDLAAKRAGIAVGDDTIRQRIAEEPQFRAPNGQFDRAQFAAVLRQNSLTEQGYAALMRREIARGVIASAVGAGTKVPKPLVEDLFRYRDEKRVAEVITIPNASITDVPTPDEAAQLRYYEDHQVRFTAPEYRGITTVELTVDAVAKDITITDDQLRTVYAERAGDFITPERRTILMAVLDDEAKAKAVADAARAGSLTDAAKANGVEAVSLDNIRKDELPEIGEAAFALKQGEVSAPVKSPLGWHVLSVTAVQPPAERTFDEVKDQLRAELKTERAAEQLYQVSNRLDDRLAGGATLEELAHAQGLNLAKIAAVDSTGKDPQGKPVPGGADLPQMVQTAFGLRQGANSNLTEGKSGAYYAVRVDSITPAAVKPLAEVRDAVIAGWQDEERARKAAEKAKQIGEQLKTGKEASAQAIAQASGASFSMTEPFTRSAQNATGLTPEMVARLFDAKPDDVVSGASGDAQLVARLREIIAADPAAKDANLAQIEATVARGMEGDLMNEFAQALQKEFPVTVHQDRIAQMYATP